MNRFGFGVSPCPLLLAATIRKHLKHSEMEQPRAVKALKDLAFS